MTIQQETQDKLDEIQSNMSGRMTKISDEVDQVKNPVSYTHLYNVTFVKEYFIK